MLHEGDEYVLTNDTSLHLRRPTTSESADIKQSFTMQNNNENKSAGYTTAMFVYFYRLRAKIIYLLLWMAEIRQDINGGFSWCIHFLRGSTKVFSLNVPISLK